MRQSKFILFKLLLLLALCRVDNVLCFDNLLGIDFISSSSNGNVCEIFGADSGCQDNNQSIRFYYGARINPNIEIRGSYSILDIKLTKIVDDFFNSPSVSSDVVDVSVLFLWPIGEQWHANLKTGLGYWTETLPGPGFFNSSGSNTGFSPVIGGELEWGKSRFRVTANLDLYPGVDEAGLVSILGVGFRYLW